MNARTSGATSATPAPRFLASDPVVQALASLERRDDRYLEPYGTAGTWDDLRGHFGATREQKADEVPPATSIRIPVVLVDEDGFPEQVAEDFPEDPAR